MSWCSAPPVSRDGWWPATWPVMRPAVSASGLPDGRRSGWLMSGRGWVRPRRPGRCWPLIRPIRCRWRRWRGRPGWWSARWGPTAVSGSGWLRPAPPRVPTTRTCPARCCSSGTASTVATTLRPARGARTGHGWGFDSVPSDLGVLLLHHAARADGAGELQDTTLVVTALNGGASGGTLASMMEQQDEVRASAERRRVVQDPYALSPDRPAEPDPRDERDLDWVRYDGDLRMWVGPFVMAGINPRVVRRSNALQCWAYGRRFRY